MESPSSRFPDLRPVQASYPLDKSVYFGWKADRPLPEPDDEGFRLFLEGLGPPAPKSTKGKGKSGENLDDLFSTIDKYSSLLDVLARGPTGKEVSTPTRCLSPLPSLLDSTFTEAKYYSITRDESHSPINYDVTPRDQTLSPFSACSELSQPQSQPQPMPSMGFFPHLEYGIAPSEVLLSPSSAGHTAKMVPVDGCQSMVADQPQASDSVSGLRPRTKSTRSSARTPSFIPMPSCSPSPSPGAGLPTSKCRGRPVPTFHDLQAVGHEAQRPYVCKYKNCYKSFKRNEHCIRHVKDTHCPKTTFICPAIGCDSEVKRRDNLYQHMRTHPFEMFPPGTKLPPDVKKKSTKAQGIKDNKSLDPEAGTISRSKRNRPRPRST